MAKPIKDLTGQVFGKLTAVEIAGRSEKGSILWLCNCECGNTYTVASAYLVRGSTKSCGCYRGGHGLSGTKLYQVYNNILTRLNNPNHPQYKDYGGRGISICDEWAKPGEGMVNFYNWAVNNGYKEGLTIDREDVNGDYSPENCRWVTMKDQCDNRRSTRRITYKGETKSAKAWSLSLGGSSDLVIGRLKLGWSEEEAVSTPIGATISKERCITYNGETLTLSQWSARLGGSPSLVASRLLNDMPEEDAVSWPKGKHYRKK